MRDAKGLTVPIITTGHLTALGVSQSESVRDIYIGSLDGFSADAFPPADYIALGHIHRPQKVAKSEHIRYSGSPIPLSFDELKYNKQVVIVEFISGKNISITPFDIPLFQPMAVLKGDLDAIKVQLQNVANALNDQPTWLFIEVEVQDHYSDLQQRVLAMADEYHVEVLKIKRARGKNQPVLTQQIQETLAELDPFDVFNKRLALETIEGDQAEAQLERIKNEFKEIVTEVAYQEPSE
ncbi:exonuclease SbcCD subunit D C-terminal domain-containing protein [Psychromonas sp. MME2]|uniref:exonuclease SbcCD subunit D C-terminal domain-containing protein n=1 Tax=Psychromonas sp. MME2 TaxID=3231033 RepID=UPI00339D1A86